jgi:hypothetical protein
MGTAKQELDGKMLHDTESQIIRRGLQTAQESKRFWAAPDPSTGKSAVDELAQLYLENPAVFAKQLRRDLAWTVTKGQALEMANETFYQANAASPKPMPLICPVRYSSIAGGPLNSIADLARVILPEVPAQFVRDASLIVDEWALPKSGDRTGIITASLGGFFWRRAAGKAAAEASEGFIESRLLPKLRSLFWKEENNLETKSVPLAQNMIARATSDSQTYATGIAGLPARSIFDYRLRKMPFVKIYPEKLNLGMEISRKMEDVPVNKIVGTFTGDIDSWIGLADRTYGGSKHEDYLYNIAKSIVEGANISPMMEPIDFLKIGDQYFVYNNGRHRVAALKALGADVIHSVRVIERQVPKK